MRRYRPTVARIDLDAVRHNVRALRPPGTELMAVVKANAYGHGDVEVARAALEAGASWLGVALVEEGIHLRDAGIDAPILVLSEFPRGAEHDALAADLTPTLYTQEGLRSLAKAAADLGRPVAVHVKVDTGMHRIGVFPHDATGAFVADAVAAGFDIEGFWTHLARAEDDEGTTRSQLADFAEAAASLATRPRLLHSANSAATIRYPDSHFDLVRPGIALYGLLPAPGLGAELGLRPAMSWHSQVTMAKRLPAGEGLSYGHTYRLERDAMIATVPVGYADGYSRTLSNVADVLIGGRRRPVVGSVTMDQLLVDCGDDPVEPGADVVLLGDQGEEEITADEVAERRGTISYEVITSVGARVPREYRGAASGGGAR
jgi:alanine racemase